MNLSFRDEVPPVPTKKKVPLFSFSPKLLIFIAAGIGVVIIGVLLLTLTSGSNPTSQMQRLSVRLETTLAITRDYHDSIENDDLRKLNSDLRILTQGSIAKLKEPLVTAGMNGISGEIKADEADTATIQYLDKAKTGGNFDNIYARIIGQKIDTVTVLMQEIFDKTKSRQLKGTLSETYADFANIRKQVKDLKI